MLNFTHSQQSSGMLLSVPTVSQFDLNEPRRILLCCIQVASFTVFLIWIDKNPKSTHVNISFWDTLVFLRSGKEIRQHKDCLAEECTIENGLRSCVLYNTLSSKAGRKKASRLRRRRSACSLLDSTTMRCPQSQLPKRPLHTVAYLVDRWSQRRPAQGRELWNARTTAWHTEDPQASPRYHLSSWWSVQRVSSTWRRTPSGEGRQTTRRFPRKMQGLEWKPGPVELRFS